jgi:hypothetical protein
MLLLGTARKLAHQRRLADPGFPCDKGQAPMPRQSLPERALELV